MWISLYESQHLHTLISKMPEVELCLSGDDGHNNLEHYIYNSAVYPGSSIITKLKNPCKMLVTAFNYSLRTNRVFTQVCSAQWSEAVKA